MINSSDALDIQKRKMHELMYLVYNGKMTYSDAGQLSISERRYIIDMLKKANDKEHKAQERMQKKTNSNSRGSIKNIGVSTK